MTAYPKRTTTRLLGLIAGLCLVAAACGDDGGGGGGGGGDSGLDGASIAVGSKEFNEQLLLGQIAILALEDAGAEVDDQTGIQGTENVRKALTSGEIDLYWEYTGTGWTTHLGNEVSDAPPDTADLAKQVADEDKKNKVVWLDPAEANNTYAIATASDRAQELGVTTMSDYAKLANDDPDAASLCAAAEFLDRDDGWPGVEETYGFKLPGGGVSEMDLNLIYARVPDGKPCNFGEVFATDGRIVGNDLTVLEDDKDFFVKYNVAMTIRQETFDQYPELKEVFDPITKLLTTEKLTELNARVDVDEELPEDVAQDFLEENNLIGG